MARIRAPQNASPEPDLPDLRELEWSSIDNDTSRDLDQIEVAERVTGGIRVRVGIADVSQSVAKGSPPRYTCSGSGTDSLYNDTELLHAAH